MAATQPPCDSSDKSDPVIILSLPAEQIPVVSTEKAASDSVQERCTDSNPAPAPTPDPVVFPYPDPPVLVDAELAKTMRELFRTSEDERMRRQSQCEKVAYDTRQIKLGVEGMMYLGNMFVSALARSKAIVFALPPVVWIRIPQLGSDGILGCMEYEPSRKSAEKLTEKEPAVAEIVAQLSDEDYAREYTRHEFEERLPPDKQTPDSVKMQAYQQNCKVKIEAIELMPTTLHANIVIDGRPENLSFSGIRILRFVSAATRLEGNTPVTSVLVSKKKFTKNKFARYTPNADTMQCYKDMVTRQLAEILRDPNGEHHYVVIRDISIELSMSHDSNCKYVMQPIISCYGTPVKEQYQ